jgi:hypothetical protein
MSNAAFKENAMTRINHSDQRRAFSTARARRALSAAGLLTCLYVPVHAGDLPHSSPSGEAGTARHAAAELEKAFWTCDYAGSTRWVALGEGAVCGEIYEELKRSKFDGDARAMLKWWQQNKTAEHRAMATESRALATR